MTSSMFIFLANGLSSSSPDESRSALQRAGDDEEQSSTEGKRLRIDYLNEMDEHPSQNRQCDDEPSRESGPPIDAQGNA